ncbi:hypothetical protein AJ79_02913 [Helicocarpus griseus UAMH5409]|uniref:Uncharacterized protein n=1 Tax=Helicocarpus griseus UAMH5409 TaxID=1447875 RepID=A0A2B7Y1A0_9EURO|nr:hypothetical protein AJ79_02913 [Helicocarpus griseus UAMH5409]
MDSLFPTTFQTDPANAASYVSPASTETFTLSQQQEGEEEEEKRREGAGEGEGEKKEEGEKGEEQGEEREKVPNANHSFPYDSYASYTERLCKADETYKHLVQFLKSPLPQPKPREKPSLGTVVIADEVKGALQFHEFLHRPERLDEDYESVTHLLNNRPKEAKTRLIIIGYFYGYDDNDEVEIEGVDRRIVDAVGMKYRVHPEMYMLQFGVLGAQEGDIDFLWQSHVSNYYLSLHHPFGCSSVYIHDGEDNQKTLIIAARNGIIDDITRSSNLFRSKMLFLNDPFPIPGNEKPASLNDLFIDELKQLKPEDIAMATHNPILYILPCAQLCSLALIFETQSASMDPTNPERLASGFDNLQRLNNNFSSLQEFQLRYPSSPLSEFMFAVLRRDVQNESQRLQGQVPFVNMSAAIASLEESKRSVQQNESLKRLTKLAFVFVPLTFVTSVFGMNLDLLGSGQAKTWMVIVAVPLAYGLGYAALALFQLWKMAVRPGIRAIRWYVRRPFSEEENEDVSEHSSE